MRFDLLDEYSTLMPFGRGVARSGVRQDLAPAKPAKRGLITGFASCLQLLRKQCAAFHRAVSSSYRLLIERCSCHF